jgi:hypothetical protein
MVSGMVNSRSARTQEDRLDGKTVLVDQARLDQRPREPDTALGQQVPVGALLLEAHYGRGQVVADDRPRAPVGGGQRLGEHDLGDLVHRLGKRPSRARPVTSPPRVGCRTDQVGLGVAHGLKHPACAVLGAPGSLPPAAPVGGCGVAVKRNRHLQNQRGHRSRLNPDPRLEFAASRGGCLGRAPSLRPSAGAEVTGAAPPSGRVSRPAGVDAGGDASLDQLRQQPLERHCFFTIEADRGLAHDGVTSGSSRTSTLTAASGQSHLHPPAVGADVAYRESIRLQLADQPDRSRMGQSERIGQAANMRSVQELLERQKSRRRAAGKPRGVLKSRRRILSKIQGQRRQQVLQTRMRDGHHPGILYEPLI